MLCAYASGIILCIRVYIGIYLYNCNARRFKRTGAPTTLYGRIDVYDFQGIGIGMPHIRVYTNTRRATLSTIAITTEILVDRGTGMMMVTPRSSPTRSFRP